MKKKEESSNKETESMASKRKENVIELKETRTPKKIKSSPAKKEVDIFEKGIIAGAVCWSGLFSSFVSNFIRHYSILKITFLFKDAVAEYRLC